MPESDRDLERALALLCIEHGFMEPHQVVSLISEARSTNKPLAQLLLGAMPATDLLAALANSLDFAFYNIFGSVQQYRVDGRVLERFDVQVLIDRAALPMVDKDGQLVIAAANPFDTLLKDYLVQYFDGRVPKMVLSPREQITNTLLRFRSPASLAQERPVGPRAVASAPVVAVGTNSAVVDFVDRALSQAVAEDASDVHFDYNADGSLTLRIRVDGILRDMAQPPRGREPEVIGYLLNKAGMDPTNVREPKDGTFTSQVAGRPIDFRAAMLPAINGPTFVVRILDSQRLRTRLDDMGFSGEHLSRMRRAMNQPQGMVVISGPTGSGKSTTLYGLLREVDAVHQKVVTIENPVEYRVDNITQVPVRDDLGERSVTFARALRTILRADPDVILLGECRDAETADVAMQAALTGHLVLTTIHTSSALGVYSRLLEMGIEPYLITDSVTLAVAQRLVRRVHDCAIMSPPSNEEAARLLALGVQPPETVPRAIGCAGCNSSGYRGRLAVVEMFTPTQQLHSAVVSRKPLEYLVELANEQGFSDLLHDGVRHVAQGHTTVQEVLRVLSHGAESEH